MGNMISFPSSKGNGVELTTYLYLVLHELRGIKCQPTIVVVFLCTVEPLLSGLWLTVPLTGMQFLSTLSGRAELWADSRSYIDTRKENGKWASE
jgi:hypothetical protein